SIVAQKCVQRPRDAHSFPTRRSSHLTLETQMAQTLAQARVFAWLLIGFALLAAVLAASGLYGTVSYWLRGRTRELGIRIALGASRPRIAALVGRQGVRLLVFAVPAGAVSAVAASRARARALVD